MHRSGGSGGILIQRGMLSAWGLTAAAVSVIGLALAARPVSARS